MSSTPTRPVSARRDDVERTTDADAGTLLGALENDACRKILEATSERALSTSELSERCDLSTSSAYRKVDELTEAGLLEKSVRLSPSGSHTSEYRLAVSRLVVSVGGGGLELSVTPREAGHPTATVD